MNGIWLALASIVVVLLWAIVSGFRRGASPDNTPRDIPTITGSGSFDVEVVGESRYQQALEIITGGRTRDGVHLVRPATLIPETDNAADKNAVRIEINAMTVGYLGRDDAAELRGQLRRTGDPVRQIRTQALITGGWHRGTDDSGMFGVRLDLPTRPS